MGLITADEVAMAGGVYESSNVNSSYYLYTNQNYWLGSPCNFTGSYSFANEFFVYDNGRFNGDAMNRSYGARPVVSLSSKAKLSGNGTWNNVYTVK